ncbi:hypothetical protein CR513_56797, partial [Mucuna pruriens]
MGLWTLLEGFLLLANALAILNEDRFLAPRGWALSDFSAGQKKSFKGQIIGNVSDLTLLEKLSRNYVIHNLMASKTDG